jgi:hypothetical protein
MEIKNNRVCPACGDENPFFARICDSCKNYLRGRIVNVDLWTTLGLLIENPFKAFQNIIYAEHKNLILFLVSLLSVKYLIITRLVSLRTIGETETTTNLVWSYLILFAILLIYFLLFAIILKLTWKKFGYITRFKDNFAVIIYSHLLLAFSLIILFPLEEVIFGNYLFSINPSPFQIKTIIAYFFFSIELFVVLWSIFLMIAAFHVSTGSKLNAVLTTLLFVFFLSAIIFFSSKIIFTI